MFGDSTLQARAAPGVCRWGGQIRERSERKFVLTLPHFFAPGGMKMYIKRTCLGLIAIRTTPNWKKNHKTSIGVFSDGFVVFSRAAGQQIE